MRSPLSSRTILKTVGTTFVGIFAVVVVVQHAGRGSFTAQSTRKVHVERIRTCAEVGLCKKGEQGLILTSLDRTVLSNAMLRGCKVKRVLQQGTVLRCPEGVTVPNSRAERVLHLIDLSANRQIGAMDLQQQGLTGEGIRVAILDTGIDATHPEIASRISLIENFTTDEAADRIGHGTHVAGIVAGQGVRAFDDQGTTNRALGVAPGAELLIGKVCGNQGWCLEGDIIAGIEWAVSQKARVINVSLGGGSFLDHCDEDPLAWQVNRAVQQGVIVVAAAGNSGGAGEGIATPGCASLAIAVGAVNVTDTRALWSSFGKALDVVAPGVGILSSVSCEAAGTCPEPAYGWWSGTSMATPNVVGLAALLLQENPSLQPADIRALIIETSKDLGDTGFDILHGHGRIDAVAALALLRAQEEVVPPEETVEDPRDSEKDRGWGNDREVRKEEKERENKNPGDQEKKNERSDTGRSVEESLRGIPDALPSLPVQAAPAAEEHRPSAPPAQEQRPAPPAVQEHRPEVPRGASQGKK